MLTPWPTRPQQRHWRETNRLLDEQAESDTAFRAIVGTALTAIKRLEFPLGCPAPGYDMQDVTSTLADWLMPIDDQALADLATDAASDRMAEAA
jgi:hypothetical protein